VLTFGEPQAADGRDRRAWAADLRNAVDALRQT
jgi:1-acyl-sn-glycerol-3-phosphate acyltransferase